MGSLCCSSLLFSNLCKWLRVAARSQRESETLSLAGEQLEGHFAFGEKEGNAREEGEKLACVALLHKAAHLQQRVIYSDQRLSAARD